MSINHTRTLNIRHFHQRTKKTYQSHCDKSHNILSHQNQTFLSEQMQH